ncbi:MAG: ABC transporter permease [Lachnospiraceae bacterium]|nr:ABC transporter permease [Lachnospiraceae bacterium]
MRFSILRGFVAIMIALLVATVLVFISAEGDGFGEKLSSTGDAMVHMLIRPLFGRSGFATKNFTDILAAMIPITFTSLAACVMFAANQFNLGAEGGIMLGAFMASIIAVYVPMPSGLHAIVAVLVAALSVGAMMIIPAVLKARLGVSEMVCSLMLNYVVMYIINYLMNTSLSDKSKGQVMSYDFQETSAIPQLVDNGSKLSWGFIVAMICVVLTALFMYRTRWGYAIRMVGINKDFSKYSGLNVMGVIILSQIIGGLLAGMGGGIELLGRYTNYQWKALPGYGWDGITVACIAGNNPILVPFAAFFIAFLDKGCNLMATYCNIPAQLIDIIEGVIFIFFAAEHFLSKYRQKLVVRSSLKEVAEQAAASEALKQTEQAVQEVETTGDGTAQEAETQDAGGEDAPQMNEPPAEGGDNTEGKESDEQ